VGATAAALVAAACGSVTRPGQAAATPRPVAPGGAPSFAPDQPVITFVVRPGADPTAVARRVAGPAAAVSPAYPGGPHENAAIGTMRRTFVVGVPVGQEQAALRRAQSDPDVQQAWFGTHLGA